MQRVLMVTAALTALSRISPAPNPHPRRPGRTVTIYDNFQKPGGYTLADYNAKWTTLTLGEMAIAETRQFNNGRFAISATPFRTAHDSSVADHGKYLAVSKQVFPVPEIGSITVSMEIEAVTPGTEEGHLVHGTYVQSGAPYTATLLEGQQAAATLHMIDFATGQLFDWFVSGHTAFPLYERLPSTVSGSTQHVGIDRMFTQIVDQVPIAPGVPHTVAIRYARDRERALVEYFLDGNRVSRVDRIGIPLDVQGVRYSGVYPSRGPGEELRDKINSVAIAHGLFSLVDAFPFQHAEAPALSVSIPVAQRLFGQGAKVSFANVVVTIDETCPSDCVASPRK